MQNDYNNSFDDISYDISDDEERILASLRYLDLADEYTLIQKVRNTGKCLSLLKMIPSFNLPQIVVNAGKGPAPAGMHKDTEKTMAMLRIILNDAGSAESIITDIRCRTAIKDKLLACLRDNETGLEKIIPALMLMNLKNYQAGIKEAIEKLILIIHTAGWKDVLNGDENLTFDERLEDIEKILSMNFSDYYSDFTDTGFLDAFNNKLRLSFEDRKIERLIEAMNADDWESNIMLLRHSIIYGSEYISIMAKKREFEKQPGFISYKGNSLKLRFKVLEVFAKDIYTCQ